MAQTKTKDAFTTLLKAAGYLEDGILVTALGAMILLGFAQIILRNFFDSGLIWGDAFLRMMVLWVGLLGALAATRDDNHITIDVLARLMPDRLKTLARLVTDAFTFIVCGFLAYHSARLVAGDRAAQIDIFAAVPAWWCELILPVAFGIIAFRYVIFFFRHLKILLAGKNDS